MVDKDLCGKVRQQMRKRNKTSYLIGEKYENVLGEIFEIIGYDEEDSQKKKNSI